MFFKNLKIYQLAGDMPSYAAMREQLARGTFAPCAGHEPMSRGWISPRKDGDLIHMGSLHNWLIALRTELKILPKDVINREAAARAEKLEEEQGYKPGRKAMKELKERITEELMPRALTKQNTTFAWFDLANKILAIDSGNDAKAEAVIEHLRHCLDALPLKPLHTELSPQSAMADWLAGGDAPSGFTIDRDCELKAAGEDKSTVRYVRHALVDEMHDEIKAHLAAGKLPTKLALTFDDRLSFILTDTMHIKRLAFLDLVKEEAEKSAEHADEQFDADFAIMTGELARAIPQIVAALGGEVKEQ